MNIIPRRRRASLLPSPAGIEDLWNRFWHELPNGNGDSESRLPEAFRTGHVPAVNIAETEESFSVTLDCPGLDEKDFKIETMGNDLMISGERKWEEEKEGKEYRLVESQYGRFARTVRLPENARIEPAEVDATYKNGVLTITIPKVEKTPTAKIEVHSG
jgi:HSP20 family protein